MAHWRDNGIGNVAGSDDRPFNERTLLERLAVFADRLGDDIADTAKEAFDEIQRLRGTSSEQGDKVLRTPELPPQGGTTSPPVGTWERYATIMAQHHAAPGWTFCQFGIRGPLEHQQSFVTGLACAPFGVSWARFLCTNPDIGYSEKRSLVALTHTPTGYAVGVFNDMELAVEAAELALRMVIDWSGFGDVEASVPTIERIRKVWNTAGIWFSPFLAYPMIDEAVPEMMPAAGVFIKNLHIAQRKPEGPLS